MSGVIAEVDGIAIRTANSWQLQNTCTQNKSPPESDLTSSLEFLLESTEEETERESDEWLPPSVRSQTDSTSTSQSPKSRRSRSKSRARSQTPFASSNVKRKRGRPRKLTGSLPPPVRSRSLGPHRPPKTRSDLKRPKSTEPKKNRPRILVPLLKKLSKKEIVSYTRRRGKARPQRKRRKKRLPAALQTPPLPRPTTPMPPSPGVSFSSPYMSPAQKNQFFRYHLIQTSPPLDAPHRHLRTPTPPRVWKIIEERVLDTPASPTPDEQRNSPSPVKKTKMKIYTEPMDKRSPSLPRSRSSPPETDPWTPIRQRSPWRPPTPTGPSSPTGPRQIRKSNRSRTPNKPSSPSESARHEPVVRPLPIDPWTIVPLTEEMLAPPPPMSPDPWPKPKALMVRTVGAYPRSKVKPPPPPPETPKRLPPRSPSPEELKEQKSISSKGSLMTKEQKTISSKDSLKVDDQKPIPSKEFLKAKELETKPSTGLQIPKEQTKQVDIPLPESSKPKGQNTPTCFLQEQKGISSTKTCMLTEQKSVPPSDFLKRKTQMSVSMPTKERILQPDALTRKEQQPIPIIDLTITDEISITTEGSSILKKQAPKSPLILPISIDQESIPLPPTVQQKLTTTIDLSKLKEQKSVPLIQTKCLPIRKRISRLSLSTEQWALVQDQDRVCQTDTTVFHKSSPSRTSHASKIVSKSVCDIPLPVGPGPSSSFGFGSDGARSSTTKILPPTSLQTAENTELSLHSLDQKRSRLAVVSEWLSGQASSWKEDLMLDQPRDAVGVSSQGSTRSSTPAPSPSITIPSCSSATPSPK